MEKKQLLVEIDSVLASLPDVAEFNRLWGVADSWLGKANAVLAFDISGPDRITLGAFSQAVEQGQYAGVDRIGALRGVVRMLNARRHSLLLETGGTGTVAIDQGMHFEYFEAVRKVIQTATEDVFIVDHYLNEDVLAKFCVFVRGGVSIRLLGTRYTSTLRPAAQALFDQRGGGVFLRTSDKIHERYVFIDRAKCVLSGASFKDGPQNAHSLITEIVDGATVLLALYEGEWDSAKVLI